MFSEGFIVTMFSLISGTIILCLPILLVFWLVSKKRAKQGVTREEETSLRQLSDGMTRMEHRIQNLETILTAQRQERRSAEQSSSTRFDSQ